jgi:S1-C subfamily serine protease
MIELRVLSGARAGQHERFGKSVIAIGRHPLSDLRFDLEADRDVSSRHAEIRVVTGRVLLRDSGSTNGTFVNGRRLEGEWELREGDVVSFGELGPRVEFRLAGHDAAAVPLSALGSRLSAGASGGDGAPEASSRSVAESTRPPAAGTRPRAESRSAAERTRPPLAGTRPSAESSIRTTKPRPTTGERIAVAVREHTRALRRTLYALALLVVAGIGGAWWMGQREASAREAQLDELLRRNASLAMAYEQELQRVSGTVSGLDSALARARDETQELRAQLERGRRGQPEAGDVRLLSDRLVRAETRHRNLLSAATFDASAVAEENGRAVAMLAVEMPDGKAYSGTAFGVTRGGLLVTNRHLVEDHQSRPVRRLSVIYADTRQWLPARVVRSSETDDLAFVQVEVEGDYPAVKGIAEGAPAVGQPVALIGYPLGTATAGMTGDVSRITARATLGVGTVSKRLADVTQIDAFAGEGSSGSPVFDASGRVVGVVYGGATESGGRIVYAVPASRLAAQIPR